MTKFRILFGTNLLILIFAAWQCAMLATSQLVSTSPDGARTALPRAPGETWLMIAPTLAVLVVAAAALGGATMLHARGRTGLATILLLIPAVPAVLGGLLLLGLMILFTLGTPGQ